MKYLLSPAIIISLLVSNAAIAQDWSRDIYMPGKKYPGFIIDSKGEKIEGFIKAGNRIENEKKVIFFSDLKDKKSKVVYKTQDIKGYQVADKTYKAMHYSGGMTAKPIRCLLLVKEGRISEYVWYSYSENYLGMRRRDGESDKDWWARYYETKTVFQNGDGKPVENSKLAMGFANKMSAFIEDYPELAKKVAGKEKGYKMLKLYDIIDEYNKWYADNNK